MLDASLLWEGFPFFEFVVYSSIVIYAWHAYLNLRQRSKLQETKPPAVLLEYKLTTKEKFQVANEYGLDKNGLKMCQDAFEVAVNMVWLAYLFAYVWQWTGTAMTNILSLDESFEKTRGVLFVVMVSAIGLVLDMGWSAYSHFVIEERHGFNKMTVAVFVTDQLKTMAITSVLAAILVPAILAMIHWAGANFVLYVWALVSVFVLVMMWLAPVVIMPCFYKFEDLNEGHLNENTRDLIPALHKLANSLSFPLQKLFVMDGSTRSSHSNAFQYGFCSNKRIVLFDTLIEQSNTAEIVAIMAHELGHWQYSHTLKQLFLTECQMFVLFFLFQSVHSNKEFYASFGFSEEKPLIVGLMLFLYLWQPVSAVWVFLSNAVTRHFEYQADDFAVEMALGEDLYSGLVAIHQENKAHLDPDWLYSAYHHSHPTLLHRLEAIKAAMNATKKL